MARQGNHTSKTPYEKTAYLGYIKKQGYEPTLEEGLKFNDSVDKDLELSTQQSKKVNRLSTAEQLKIHFKENWINWVVAGGVIILTYLMIESKITNSNHDIKITNSEKQIDENKADINNLKESQHQQDMKIQENSIKLDNVTKEVEKKK